MFKIPGILPSVEFRAIHSCTENNFFVRTIQDNFDTVYNCFIDNPEKRANLVMYIVSYKPEFIYLLLNLYDNIHYENDLFFESAIVCLNYDFAKYLIINGVDPQTNDNIAMKLCSSDINDIDNGLDFMNFLVEHKCDVTIDNNYPIKQATNCNNIDMVKFLFDNGANIHVENDFPLRIACYDISENDIETSMIEYLLSIGANYRADNNYPLRLCIMANQIPTIKILLKYGANLDELDIDILIYSIANSTFEMIEFLVSAGINYDKLTMSNINALYNMRNIDIGKQKNVVEKLVRNNVDPVVLATILLIYKL